MANYAQTVTNYTDALNAVTFPAVDRNKIQDQVFDTSPLYAVLRHKKLMRFQRGGLFIQRTINVGKSPNASWYTGAGNWTMSTFQGLVAMGWDWKLAHDGIVVTGEEIVKNEYSDEAIVELVQGRVDITSLTLPDLVSGDVYNNNPYGNNLDGTTGNPSSIEGLCVLVDDGTFSSTVGQQSRTTYPVLKSKVNYNNALGSSFISAIQSLYTSANRGQTSRTTLNLTTEAIYNSYWGSLQSPERYIISTERLAAIGLKTTGGNDLAFNDTVILVDEKIPTATQKPNLGGGSGGYWYGLNLDFFEYIVHPDRFYGLGDWYKDQSGDQYFMDLYLACALLCTRPNKQFVSWVSGG